MVEPTPPYCHGRPMTQVSFTSSQRGDSRQYRCDQCARSEFVQDKPDKKLTMEELQRRLDTLAERPARVSDR